MKDHKKVILLYILATLISFSIVAFLLPKVSAPKSEHQTIKKESISYVALGDSLTEGIGDEDMQGFVLRLADDLENHYPLCVTTKNYGKSGDRSDQIVRRLQENKAQQQAIKKADIITLTVGGNDLLQTLSKNIEEIKPSVLKKARQTYSEKLEKLYRVIRQYNSHAVIYQLGIYNPFYYNFKSVQELQKSINQWNSTSETIVATQKKSYFIPINEVISKGTKEDQRSSVDDDQLKNHLLSRDDYFHPNAQGYTMMADKVFKEMKKTKDQWWP